MYSKDWRELHADIRFWFFTFAKEVKRYIFIFVIKEDYTKKLLNIMVQIQIRGWIQEFFIFQDKVFLKICFQFLRE